MTLSCSQCAAQNSDTAKFCKGCGFDLRAVAAVPQQVQAGRVCIKCKTMNAFSAKFCKACGTSTTEGAPVPPPVTALAAEVSIFSPPARQPAPVPPTSDTKELSPTTPLPSHSRAPVSSFPDQTPKKPPSNPGNEKANNINSVPKRAAIKKYVVWGCALTVVLAFAGATAYWFSGDSGNPTNKPASAQVIPTATAAAPAVAPASLAPVSHPAEVPATNALPVPAITAVPAIGAAAVQNTEAPKIPGTSNVEINPGKAPAVIPPEEKAEWQLIPNSAQDKRKAEEAARKKRAEREALAKQRERDKAKLNHANQTLDDLLK